MTEIKGTDVSGFKTQYKTAQQVTHPERLVIDFNGVRIEYGQVAFPIRYGTNPNQQCFVYKPLHDNQLPIGNMTLVKGGKAGLSLTNIQDMSQALNILKYFPLQPACAVMKHLNPSGFKAQTRQAETQDQIYINARDCDARSAFGSVVGFNRAVDKATAEAIMSTFVEGVIAPSYEEGVLNIFRRNEDTKKLNNAIRIAEARDMHTLPKYEGDLFNGYYNIKTLADGTIALEMPFLTKITSAQDFIVDPMVDGVTVKRLPTKQELEDGLTAWYLNINVRSNGIVFVKDGAAISVGTGQQERVGAVEQAIAKAKQKGHSLEGAVMSSDAFFPDRDSIDAIAKEGVRAVVWPAGSMADKKIIEAANEYDIALMCTQGERCFAHF